MSERAVYCVRSGGALPLPGGCYLQKPVEGFFLSGGESDTASARAAAREITQLEVETCEKSPCSPGDSLSLFAQESHSSRQRVVQYIQRPDS